MMLAHAVALAQARSYLAALADHAADFEASLGYERTLLHLDAIYGDHVPALDTHLDTHGLLEDRAGLQRRARSAVEELRGHGIDALKVELVLAMLDGASALDTRGTSSP